MTPSTPSTKRRLKPRSTPLPSDPEVVGPFTDPLPKWVERLRPHQWKAAREAVKAYESGAKVVFVDAPTGSGKTLIAELIRRQLGVRGLYICSTKSLQDQVNRDFPYSHLLKGRANYPTELEPFPRFSADDCTKTPNNPDCRLCKAIHTCPYQVAKRDALKSQLGIVNTSYFLVEANFIGKLSGVPFIIADECDTLESALMGFVEFTIPKKLLEQLQLEPPKKGSHKSTLIGWLKDTFIPVANAQLAELSVLGQDNIALIKKARRLRDKIKQAEDVAEELRDDNWVRDSGEPFSMKPVTVNRMGSDVLWRHSSKFLCMSASIISTTEMADSLGLTGDYEVVTVPSTFPSSKRPVFAIKAGDMTRKGLENTDALVTMASALTTISNANPDVNVLAHTHSYKLNQDLMKRFAGGHRRRSYANARDREEVVKQLKLMEEPTFTFAPSLDRGIDLPDDECRITVICKVPFPYLGSRQVSERLHTKTGQAWYTAQTVRAIIQMTGRPVRHRRDWAVTYILDDNFFSFFKKNKQFFPDWWLKSFTAGRYQMLSRDVREVIQLR